MLITFSLKDFKYGKQTLNVIICTIWYYLVLKLVDIDRLISYALQSFHHSYVLPKTTQISENDCQPVVLNDEFMELNHGESRFPNKIELITIIKKT